MNGYLYKSIRLGFFVASILFGLPAGAGAEMNSAMGITNLTGLLSVLEQKSKGNLSRDQRGDLTRLRVPLSFVSDTNLTLISECPTLKELDLRFTTKDYAHLTTNGFNQLQHLPRLAKLKINCPLYIATDCFASICRLTNLTSLSLMLAPPAEKTYFFLTNLIRLFRRA